MKWSSITSDMVHAGGRGKESRLGRLRIPGGAR
jgi:hypothetical protein